MFKFFHNVIVKIVSVLLVACLIGGYFLYPDFYIKQLNKVKGMWHVHLGDEAYANGNLKMAVKYYNIALKEYPEHSQARCNLANIYVSFEDYTSAVEQYETALKYNPKFIVCRMNLGIIEAEKLSQFDEAIRQYKTVADTKRFLIHVPLVYSNVEPTKANKEYAYYNMGLAYRGKSLFTPREKLKNNQYLIYATEAYEKSILLNKSKRGLFDKILGKFGYIRQKNRDNYDTLYNLALTNHLLGNYKEAGLNYCKAIETKPLNYEAHMNLAILLDSMGYYNDAIIEYNRAGALMGDANYAETIYLNDLINSSYKKKAVKDEKDVAFGLNFVSEEDKKAAEKEMQKIEKKNKKVFEEEKKLDILEDDEMFFKKIGNCEVKKIFEDEL